MTVEVCKLVWRMTSVEAEWTLNRTPEELHERAKSLVEEDTCMKYYNVRKPQYLETDTSGKGLDVTLLQVWDTLNCGYVKIPHNAMLWPIAFASKSLSFAEWQYSNIEREALRILHEFEKFHFDCFAHELCIITDHKPLIVIIGKDVEHSQNACNA